MRKDDRLVVLNLNLNLNDLDGINVEPTSFHIALIVILLTTTFPSGCSARMNDHDKTESTSPAGQPPLADDEQLIREVEQFASSDERVSDSSWQSLQGRHRSKLIGDLTRISTTSAPDDRNRALIAFTFCNLGHEYASNRKIVVSAISKNPPFKHLFGDWAVSLVRRLMIKGDHELLVVLFDASNWSDGAMSMELAHAYSQALVTYPETFLRMLSSQSEATRSSVVKLLKSNSLTEDENTKVKSYLKNVSRQSKLRPIAEQTLGALTN